MPVASAPGVEAVGPVGAVVVSQSTSRILRALWAVRLDIFEVFTVSLVAAALLSLVLSATIARPLVRLRDEAKGLLDARDRLRKTFRRSGRHDEIGDLARALEELTLRLERHIRFVESFSGDLAHEFRNPLASIRAATEVLAEADDPAERRELLETVEREVARMDRLLSGVRELSRIDAGARAGAGPETPVDLVAITDEVVRAWRRRLDRRVRLDAEAPSSPILVTVSPERLSQALENLLDNAVGFSPDGGTVKVTVCEEEGLGVLRVDDEGPGIPEEHLGKVFERFFTFRPGSGRGAGAHDGLGLAIVRSIVEAHGGSASASNRPGGGASLVVRFPRA